ncbi:MAG: hypothetical protein FWC69_03290 [Defluviitaleaceae bacterium]|nr:hypothetical protein [Defluviitaleaceae bacterium]
MKANYKRGGIFVLIGTVAALIIARVMDAPIMALLSIAGFGFTTAMVLIFVGSVKGDK